MPSRWKPVFVQTGIANRLHNVEVGRVHTWVSAQPHFTKTAMCLHQRARLLQTRYAEPSRAPSEYRKVSRAHKTSHATEVEGSRVAVRNRSVDSSREVERLGFSSNWQRVLKPEEAAVVKGSANLQSLLERVAVSRIEYQVESVAHRSPQLPYTLNDIGNRCASWMKLVGTKTLGFQGYNITDQFIYPRVNRRMGCICRNGLSCSPEQVDDGNSEMFASEIPESDIGCRPSWKHRRGMTCQLGKTAPQSSAILDRSALDSVAEDEVYLIDPDFWSLAISADEALALKSMVALESKQPVTHLWPDSSAFVKSVVRLRLPFEHFNGDAVDVTVEPLRFISIHELGPVNCHALSFFQ